MSQNSVQIVGDKTNGYVLYDPLGCVVYTFDPKLNAYSPYSALPKLTPGTDPVFITGNAKSGVVYCSGKQVFYLTDIGNSQAKWKALLPAPFNIKGICGDLLNGVVIHDGDKLAQIKDVFNHPLWQTTAVSPRIPIAGIAGDGTNGIVVYGPISELLESYYDASGNFVPSVYKFAGQPYGSAIPMQEPPIHIDFLIGDGSNGYVAFGENQLFSLDAGKGVWTKICSLNFTLTAAAGNPKDGLTAMIGKDNFVAVTDFKQWSLVQTMPVLSNPVAMIDVPTLVKPASAAPKSTDGNVDTTCHKEG